MASSIYIPARGCVFAFDKGGGGTPIYKIEGLNEQGSGGGGSGEGGSDVTDGKILINNADIGDADTVLPVSTVNDKKILYVFGTEFGQVQIMGEILLGKAGAGGQATAINKVIEWFKQYRVSGAAQTAFNLSVAGGQGYKVFAVGMALGAVDPEYNIIQFRITGLLAEPPQ